MCLLLHDVCVFMGTAIKKKKKCMWPKSAKEACQADVQMNSSKELDGETQGKNWQSDGLCRNPSADKHQGR
jgi:hypothetical protein